MLAKLSIWTEGCESAHTLPPVRILLLRLRKLAQARRGGAIHSHTDFFEIALSRLRTIQEKADGQMGPLHSCRPKPMIPPPQACHTDRNCAEITRTQLTVAQSDAQVGHWSGLGLRQGSV